MVRRSESVCGQAALGSPGLERSTWRGCWESLRCTLAARNKPPNKKQPFTLLAHFLSGLVKTTPNSLAATEHIPPKSRKSRNSGRELTKIHPSSFLNSFQKADCSAYTCARGVSIPVLPELPHVDEEKEHRIDDDGNVCQVIDVVQPPAAHTNLAGRAKALD